MKKYRVVVAIGLLALLACGHSMAQNSFQTQAKSQIEPLSLDVAYQKTTNLLFPYAVKSVDRGSRDLLVQKAKGVENILQVKAGTADFKETNLTVIVGDGSLYSFLMNYAEEPTALNLELADKPVAVPLAVFTDRTDNEARILDAAERVAVKQRMLRRIKDNKFDVGIRLNGVYIVGNVIYYQLELENNSNISYDVEQLRFYIRDKKKVKRTATQEVEQEPLLLSGNTSTINPKSRQHVVVALDKFTIPDKKELIIQLMEHNGGRHLQLKVNNKTIVKAKAI